MVKYYTKTKIEIVYEKENLTQIKNNDNAIGIDIGLKNLCAITSNNQNLSWIVKGGTVKSINKKYNEEVSKLYKEMFIKNKNQKKSKKLDILLFKRKNKLETYMHQVSRKIINLCIKYDISKIIIGHNNEWKQNINLGKRNNQNFVSVPFDTLIKQIMYKAKNEGIECIITEESYTSKTDHLAFESMTHIEDKNRLGKRSKRGKFVSSINHKILNADINGAIGMLRKKKAITDEQLLFLRNRGDVVSPKVLNKSLTFKYDL